MSTMSKREIAALDRIGRSLREADAVDAGVDIRHLRMARMKVGQACKSGKWVTVQRSDEGVLGVQCAGSVVTVLLSRGADSDVLADGTRDEVVPILARILQEGV